MGDLNSFRMQLNSDSPRLQRLPLLWPVGCFVVGVALARSDLFNLPTAALLLVALIVLFALLRRFAWLTMLLFGIVLGAANLLWSASRVAVDHSWLGEVSASATVVSVTAHAHYRRLLIDHMQRDDHTPLAGRALLYQHAPFGDAAKIAAGARIHVNARWRLPHNQLNPAAFDYRAWCFDRHIALIGSVKGGMTIVAMQPSWLQRQRTRLRTALHQLAPQPAGVLQALLLGDRSQISEPVYRAFAATGTAHLLAISGMHIGMAAAWMLAIVWWLVTRREAWIVQLPVRRIALFAGFLAACAYATLAGWPLPALRATVMLGAAVLAWQLSARHAPLNILLAALALILLFDPAAISSLSLWLSFVATAALLLWAVALKQLHPSPQQSWRQRLSTALLSLLWISLLATLATLPMIVAGFGRLPIYTLAANLLLVPLYALLVMPAALLGTLLTLLGWDSLAGFPLQLAATGVDAGLTLLHAFTELPAGELWARLPPWWSNLLYAVGMITAGWLLLRQQRRRAALTAVATLALFLAAALHETPIAAPAWYVWDVGQGAASTLLLPDDKVIVVDLPGRRGSRFNGGSRVAAELRRMGLIHVDLLILSHAQSDHLGGALTLLRQLNHIGEIWLPDVPAAHSDRRVQRIVAWAERHHATLRWMAAGDTAQFGDTALNILWPPRHFDPPNANNGSLVVTANITGPHRLLWPGDMEAPVERQLLPTLQPVEAMLMPHHGSNTSSTPALLARLRLKLAIAQTGYHNRFNFPRPDVVARYRALGSMVKNSAEGALTINWPDDRMAVTQYQPPTNRRRALARRLWHWMH